MRIRSVGHACLEIEAGGLRVVTDPWWAGPSYTGQWHQWPPPRPDGLEQRAVDYLYLSHGHEDHFHVPTLRTLRPGTTALVPEFLTGSLAPYLRDELAFGEVVELRHGETVRLRRGVTATCYVNLSDSMLVLEDGDRVLVDATDALHASPPAVIDHFCRILRRRHARVDTLFLGFAGASWYPNCLRVAGKDDRAAARAREQLFCDNFVRVVERLQPRLACAFAASFALVEPHNRWINEVKFEVPFPDEQYRRRHPHGPSQVHLLLPDDVVDGVDVMPGPVERPSAAGLDAALRGELREACERAERLPPISTERLRALIERIDARVRTNRPRLGRVPPFSVELRLRDAPDAVLHVDVEADTARASAGPARRPAPALDLRAEVLEAALREDYGIESVVIGYGAVATLDSRAQYSNVIRALRLMSPRQGDWRAVAAELRRHPLRAASALWRQRGPLALSVATRFGLVHAPEFAADTRRPEPSSTEAREAA